MDKLTSINIEEGASVGSPTGGKCADRSKCCATAVSQSAGPPKDAGKPEHNTTISAQGAHRAEPSPTTLPPKTEETTKTLAASGPHDASNNAQGSPACEDGQDQGQHKPKENEGVPAAASAGRVTQAIMSESLANLLAYGSSSEDSEADSVRSLSESESDSDEESSNDDVAAQRSSSNDNVIATVGKYRESRRSSDSGSSTSDESSDAESSEGAKSEVVKPTTKRSPHADGELGLDDLPPVPDLSKLDINVKAEDCLQMGNITSVVDRLVMVQSLPNTPAYDLDTLLFLDQGKHPLGHVYDVLGQVTSPMYVVRFNSKQEIEAKGITKGMPVYSAPETEHTQYVFLKELMKFKGSDASWQGDNEVPPEFLDFSDDEAEYNYAKQSQNEQDTFDNKRKRNSLEKHRMFESSMNLKNKIDTARHKVRDTCEVTPKRFVPQNSHPAYYYPPPNINQMRQQCGTSFTSFPPPNFVAPPPNFTFVNVGPAMVSMSPFAGQFGHGMPPFPPSPQPFPPPAFGPPAIPPLPALPQHLLPQPQPPPAFTGSMSVLPPNMAAMNVPKQQANIPKSPKTPKVHHNGGVVPKTPPSGPKSRNVGLPKLYIPPPANYQPPYPPHLGLPKSAVPPFATNPPPNIPVSMPPPFGPPMPPWPYNLPRTPHGARSFQAQRSGGRSYKKQ